MRRFFSHVWILAEDELGELLFRKRAIISFIFYAAMISCIILSLSYLEERLGPTLGLFRGVSPAPTSEALQEAERRGLGAPARVFAEIASWPSPVVILGILSICWFPVLVAMVSCDMIAQDVHRGTLRFLLLRTSRLAYFFSKTAAHLFLYLVMYLLSAAILFVVSAFREEDFSIEVYGIPMLRYGAVTIPFLLFLVASTQFISTWSGKPVKALVRLHGLWLIFIMMLFFIPWLSPLWGEVSSGLFAPLNAHLIPAVGGMLAWSLIFLTCGFVNLKRRDL